MGITTRIIKNLLAVGLISTVKIATDFLIDDEIKTEAEPIVEVEKTDLSEILDNIRAEMTTEMSGLHDSQKMLRNYVNGRLATIDDIEKRLQ